MALRFYQNGIRNMAIQLPNEELRDLQQASIHEKWDVTTAKHTVKEQDEFGKFTFHDVEVWYDYVVGVTSTFLKNGNDYRKLIFESIDHECLRGRYYKFDNSYWIADFTDPDITLEKFVTVRRCNNYLRIVDPNNGRIVEYPCVIDYDASSPSPQIGSNIITPNNHLSVIVQGNKETSRLFTLNKRFLLGGRPFKIAAFQNALMPVDNTEQTNVLYLDMYLDEEHGLDDLEKNLAYNGTYVYEVKIRTNSHKIMQDTYGKLYADVTCNGKEVDMPVLWSTDDKEVIMVNHNGEFRAVGRCGQFANITATLGENPDVKDAIELTIGEQKDLPVTVFFDPEFDSVKQYENIDFDLMVTYNGKSYSGEKLTFSEISLSPVDSVLRNNYVAIYPMENNHYRIEGLKFTNTPIPLYCEVRNDNPNFEKHVVFNIMAKSMIG